MNKLPTHGLRKPTMVAGYSMDAVDRASFQAGPSPFAGRPKRVPLHRGRAVHADPVPVTPLDGEWQMAEGGAPADRLGLLWSDAIPAQVPGSVHAALEAAGVIPDQTVGRNQQIAKQYSFKTWWFRRTFSRPEGSGPFQLAFDGVCVHCTVFLNGRRLGEHEGMFGGPFFDVTDLLRDENELVLRIEPAPRQTAEGGHAHLNHGWRKTVVFNNVYGWHYSDLPSLGIWRSVRVESSPAVKINDPFIASRDTEGNVDLGLQLIGATHSVNGTLHGTIEPENFDAAPMTFKLPVRTRSKAARLHLQLKVHQPQLWWPIDTGGKPNLYRMTLSFVPANKSGPADTKSLTFGLRTIEMRPLSGVEQPDKYNWQFVINGRPMFIKGTGWCTLDPLMDFRRERYERFLRLARDQHCQMVRGWGSGMPETDDFYDLCDAYGIMVMQEWPTAWNSHEDQPSDVLEETVRLNTLRLRNRPSLVMWGAGNESNHPFGKAIDMMGRLSIELDGTRPFHRGQPWGGSDHGYPAYWARMHIDRHVTAESDFFGEFGLASLPMYESVQRYLPADEKDLWPAPPEGAFAYHMPVFNVADDLNRQRQFVNYFVHPDTCTMETFTIASQLAQVLCLRYQLERARWRWPRCGGALYYKLNDNFPACSWATADWYGAPKIGHYFVQDAFAPLHSMVLFDRLNCHGSPLNPAVGLVDDTNQLKNRDWRVLTRAFNARFEEIGRLDKHGHGSVRPQTVVGQLTCNLPHATNEHKFTPKHLIPRVANWEATQTCPLLIVSEVRIAGSLADRTFYFLNCEYDHGCLFRLPKTRLAINVGRNGKVKVTNRGNRPAVGVNVSRPGHLDTFTVSDNYFWLDAGESLTVTVSDNEGLTVDAWNAPRIRGT